MQKRATPAQYLKCDLKNFDLSTIGKYDVILLDPPIPEYQRRLEGTNASQNNNYQLQNNFNTMNSSNSINNNNENDKSETWSFEEIANLRIESLSDNCCFLFMWVGSSEGLDKGRQLLKKWNFRRCEDIVWIKTNRHNPNNRRFVNDKDTLITHTKEHCLVGIKGAVKRGVDGHFIHANIDTDVIVSEEPEFGSTEKPQELYRMIERFCLGRKRIELFGEDHNIRPGWVTLGKSLSSSYFDIDMYNSYFQGDSCFPEVQGFQGGRYVGCTQEIESLRPRSPVRTQGCSIINPLSNNMGWIHCINNSSSNSNYHSCGLNHNNNPNNWRNSNNHHSNGNFLNNNNFHHGHGHNRNNSGNFNNPNHNNNSIRFNNNNIYNGNMIKNNFFNQNHNHLNGNNNYSSNINFNRNQNNHNLNHNNHPHNLNNGNPQNPNHGHNIQFNNSQGFIPNKNPMIMNNNNMNPNFISQQNSSNQSQFINTNIKSNSNMIPGSGQLPVHGNVSMPGKSFGNIYADNIPIANSNGNVNANVNFTNNISKFDENTNVNNVNNVNLNNSMNSKINYMQNS